MEIDEFQKKYHDYCVVTEEECLREIEQMEPIIDRSRGLCYAAIHPVNFPGLGWCLMVDTAVATIRELGIID